MEFGLCPVLHPHTPYVSSVITFRSLFGAQWQRDWVGHSLTTVSVSHRQGREYADTLNTHREESVCHCGLVQFPKLGLRCCPEILNTVDHSVFSALAFFVCYNNQSVDTVILYVCLLSCMFFSTYHLWCLLCCLTTLQTEFPSGQQMAWCHVVLHYKSVLLSTQVQYLSFHLPWTQNQNHCMTHNLNQNKVNHEGIHTAYITGSS